VSIVEAGNIVNSNNDPEAAPVLYDDPRRYGKAKGKDQPFVTVSESIPEEPTEMGYEATTAVPMEAKTEIKRTTARRLSPKTSLLERRAALAWPPL